MGIENKFSDRGFWAIWVLVIVVVILIAGIVLYQYIDHHASALSDNTDDWGDFGAYFGGLVTPIVSLIALVAFIGAMHMQRKEWSATQNVVERQSFDSNFIALVGVMFDVRQGLQSKIRVTDTDAYITQIKSGTFSSWDRVPMKEEVIRGSEVIADFLSDCKGEFIKIRNSLSGGDDELVVDRSSLPKGLDSFGFSDLPLRDKRQTLSSIYMCLHDQLIVEGFCSVVHQLVIQVDNFFNANPSSGLRYYQMIRGFIGEDGRRLILLDCIHRLHSGETVSPSMKKYVLNHVGFEEWGDGVTADALL